MVGGSTGFELLTVFNYARHWTSKHIRRLCRRQLITFDIIPDDVLLKSFDFYVRGYADGSIKQYTEQWIRLAHVCRRWRAVVFQSPHRLNLQLVSTPRTPTRDLLDIWPHLPLIIHDINDNKRIRPDNIIAALEHNDRVSQIKLFHFLELGCFTNSEAILDRFPELAILWLGAGSFDRSESVPKLPDSFLGGSAPRLQSLSLDNISFPALPKFLLSATHLIYLGLSIPRSGYIPPAAMATSLSALSTLEYLRLGFKDPPPRPALGTRHPRPPLMRSILPSLTKIEFVGPSEYLEVVLAWFDAPLERLHITFFNQLIFDTPQLFQFISRTPTLRAPECHIEFSPSTIIVKFKFPSQTSRFHGFNVGVRCASPEWQLSSLEQVCSASFPPVSTLEYLYISENRYDRRPHWQDDVENTQWLDLLRSFVAVKNLYISEGFVPRIAPALQELVGGRTTEVLPALENIFLEWFRPSGPLHEGLEKFVATRSVTSLPVIVSRWDRT